MTAVLASSAPELRTTPDPGLLRDWDALVAAGVGSDVTQLSVWARVRALEGFRPGYVFALAGGDLVGGVQVLLRSVPGLGRIGYVSYGPVLAPGSAHRAAAVATLAERLAGLPGVRMLFVQPAEDDADVRGALLARGFRPSAAGIAPTGSVRLDLAPDAEEIRRGFPPRLRSWTRRWADAGVTVRLGGEDDVPVLTGLMRMAAEARGYSRPPRPEYVRHMYTELARTGNAALFIGEVHGRPVTADLVTLCGSTVRGRLSGFDRGGEGGRLSVPGAARWEIIRWAQRAGYRWLDFGGLSEQTLRDVVDAGERHSKDWPGPDHAKLQYGGAAFRYPGPVELIRPGAVRSAYDLANGSPWGRDQLHRAKVALRSGARGRRPVVPEGART